jgi:hypothetical protein
MADEFADHKYFEADYTTYRQSEDLEECIGIFVGEKPHRKEAGNKVMSMRFPAIIISEWTSNPMEFAKTLAEVLQENADRFFSSACKTQCGHTEERSDEMSPAAGSQPDTSNLDSREHNEMPERANG